MRVHAATPDRMMECQPNRASSVSSDAPLLPENIARLSWRHKPARMQWNYFLSE
jgi:hypothetical protein